LAGIAILIQLIACINFMNLSTARASKRAKEVGVRKIIGAERIDLVMQFMGESFLLTLTGVLLAIPLLYLAIPYLNQVIQTDIQLTSLSHFSIWLILAAIVIVTGAVAGLYPAFYLSAFQAVKVIKGNFTSQVSASGIRRALVVFQFFLSIVLITSFIIIYSQLNFIKNKDLGFDQSQKLVFNFYTGESRHRMPALATDLQQLAEVKYASLSDSYLSNSTGDFPVYLAGGNPSTSVDAQNMAADERFVKANGIKIIAGRDFDVKDTLKTLINETLCKRLGLKTENAPGTRLFSKYFDGSVHTFDIAGVMKDFNYNSLHGEVGPFMIFHNGNPDNYFPFMTVSVISTDYRSLLSKMERVWRKNLPGVPFEYAFLDQQIQKQYEAEISLSKIINAFTIMAILISCLGLFGLSAFSAEQRQKEIGIRKVLGASVAGVVGLLSKEFVRLVGIAFILATPLSWWAMNKWLDTFAYKVPVSWWMFAIAGILSISIALITVGFQAIKAALMSPVKSLKTE
jgi:putative ABC transport system permease protein